MSDKMFLNVVETFFIRFFGETIWESIGIKQSSWSKYKSKETLPNGFHDFVCEKIGEIPTKDNEKICQIMIRMYYGKRRLENV